VFSGIREENGPIRQSQAIKEGSDMKKTTKEIRKDKKFWADPMCYPVFAAKR
jgi:hypothetical protein